MRVYHGAVGSVGSSEDIQSHNITHHRDYPSLFISNRQPAACVSLCVCLAKVLGRQAH